MTHPQSELKQMGSPARGEVWLADLSPSVGREQRGQRPVVVVSPDEFNAGPAELVIVLPLTSKRWPVPIPTHVPVRPPEGGVSLESTILCEQIRSISRRRLVRRWGKLNEETLVGIQRCLRHLLWL